MFQAKVPARKFKSYVCTTHAAKDDGIEAKHMSAESAVHAEDMSETRDSADKV
jgi:hypothetical protein